MTVQSIGARCLLWVQAVYSSDEITYHLEQLKEMGLIDSPGSQPMLGVTFAGLSPLGHDLTAQYRNQSTDASPNKAHPDVSRSRKVFIVHGRDDAAKNEVALFLRKIGLEDIILHERPNGGRHLLTKFREEAEGAAFAVILMTPDDVGGLAGVVPRPRARQNVVLELGFFIGKLGPANVAALVKGDVEKPSDFDGIAYITFDPAGHWKKELARELNHAEVPLDPAKVLIA